MTNGMKTVLRRNLAAALERGDEVQAELILERLKEEDPLSVETRGMELEFLMRCGRAAEARVLATQLVQLFPSSPRILFLAGQLAYRDKDYSIAAERFRESNRLREHWRSRMHVAKALTQLGEFDEAAALFESLLPEHSECYIDVAWLYERRHEYDRALTAIDAYLKRFPDSEFAKNQQMRLRARGLDPQELVSESQELLNYGEELSESMIPEYVEAMFRTGRSAEVRGFLQPRSSSFNPSTASRTAWICYRYQAFDLAYELFTLVFEAQRGNVKYLSALEFAANRVGRVPELIRLYEAHLRDDRRLYGRLHRLRRRS